MKKGVNMLFYENGKDLEGSYRFYFYKDEVENSLALAIELPGVKKEEIDLRFDESNKKLIFGVNPLSNKTKAVSKYVFEDDFSDYDIKSATYVDGVLRVNFKLKEKVDNTRKIEITT